MTTKEAWSQIIVKPKWYAGIKTNSGNYHTAQSANRIKNRFKQGVLSFSTIEKILNHYGYERTETVWQTPLQSEEKI